MTGPDWLMVGALGVWGLMGLLVGASDHFAGRGVARKMFPNNPALW